MKNKIGRNDLCRCGSGIKYKKCCLMEKRNCFTDETYLTQILEEVESKVGEKVKPLFIEQNCDIDGMKKAGLLKDIGDGLYEVIKSKAS
ncbi:MAG: SEC-C metal-binding domain-containing protein [Smithellaceae bacterium]